MWFRTKLLRIKTNFTKFGIDGLIITMVGYYKVHFFNQR